MTQEFIFVFDIFSGESLISGFQSNPRTLAHKYLRLLRSKNQLDTHELAESTKWHFKSTQGNSSIFDVVWEDSGKKEKFSIQSLEPQGCARIDYRFTKINMQSVDMTPQETTPQLKAKCLGYGVIRLYKVPEGDTEERSISGDKTMVAILAVPSYFSAIDVMGFIGESVQKTVSHFRLVRSDSPNRFMVFIKFRDNESALKFQQNFNGKPFSSMDPETCHVVFIKRIVFRSPKLSKDMERIPYLLDDPFTTTYLDDTTPKLLNKPLAPPTGFLDELPTCPVCLERMDSSITGLLTIPCQHTFHCSCLFKWRDDSCPVCRYTSRENPFKEDDETKCVDCGAADGLWICLVCGNVACGRYESAHAVHHYGSTGHCFAIDTSTQRVWDYAGDGYVHRLIQNEADGKLVELPPKNAPFEAVDTSAKVENIGTEYSKLLISQLESQRQYYEEKFAQSADRLVEANELNLTLAKRLENVEERLKQRDSTSHTQSQMDALNKKMNNMASMCKVFEKKYKEERSLGEALSKKVDHLAEENKELKATKGDLQDQVTDLMFFLEGREKFKDADETVRDGRLVIEKRSRRKR